MTFSILHTSARPEECLKVHAAWMAAARYPENVQYVMCIDPRWGFSQDPEAYRDWPANITVQLNTGRRCYVDGVNIAAKVATGDVLIVNADDQYPCEGWDEKLLEVFPTESGGSIDAEFICDPTEKEFVISVSTGTPDEHSRKIMVMPILSRARYEKLGYVFYSRYESVFADNDFCEHAEKDGVVIDARHLLFPHKHWMNRSRPVDDQDRAQNRPEAYQTGKAIFEKRQASGFADVSGHRSIALCLAGERFEGAWVDAMLTLYGHLVDLGFSVLRIRPASFTNVYVAREEMRREVLNFSPKVDLVLWLDDDNILSPDHFDRLLELLDSREDVAGVSAWCWINNPQLTSFGVSCGLWAPDRLHWQPFPSSFANSAEVREFEVGGLPCLLMRRDSLEKVGDGCFMPIVDNRLEHGTTGEDISFFLAAYDKRLKFLVDPAVQIPHLKFVSVSPWSEEQGKAPVKVACMMRVKNEARWVGRTIESVKALCGSDIYVMEDNSTDDTAAVAERAGAIVLHSPFTGFDERRDKNWLLNEVVSRCSPDWIFMPDGDEELEAEGCEKIRRILDKNPPVDVFGLRFLYFWNGLDQVRMDGQYGTLLRRSLFRPVPGLEFKSYYTGKGANDNHVGLHVSNAPGIGFNGLRDAPMQVFLYHYGYVFKEDRIRKFKWIIELDPHNELEDNYRHTIQGDGPVEVFDGRVFDIPADEKLKHAGPMELRKLPHRLVPKFLEMPKPFEVETACAAN